jgi:hypothetical protein
VIVRVTWEEWNAAPDALRDEFAFAVRDYLRRSGEEISEQEEWGMLSRVMLGDPSLLLLVALGPGLSLQGFALARLLPGTSVTGPELQVWQAYVWPGRAKLLDLVGEAMPLLEAYARGAGARRMIMVSRRSSPGYVRLLQRVGFEPWGIILTRSIPKGGGQDEVA